MHGLFLLLLLPVLAGCNPIAAPGGGQTTQPAAPAVAAPAPAAAAAAEGTAYTGAELSALSLPEQLRLVEPRARDQAALRRALDPSLPATVAAAAPRTLEVGDVISFWVHDSSSASNEEREAELVYITDHAYAWVEVGRDANLRLIKRATDSFSDTIYPAVTALFGSEPNPGIDGDARVHILHTSGMGYGVAGYFSGSDANDAAIVPHSNEKEMFYVSLDWLEFVGDSVEVEMVLAHEFQHMVHFAHDRNEEVWVNEGLSEYAKEVAGYPPDTSFANLFGMLPDTQLNSWGGGNDDNSAHYGGAYLFMRYLAQRFGPQIAGELVREPADGLYGVRAVLQRYGAGFEEVYADWLVANAVDDTSAGQAGGGVAASSAAATAAATAGSGPRFGHVDFDSWYATYAAEYDEYPARERAGEVANFGADYVNLQADGELTLRLEFAGDTTTRIAGGVPLPAAEADGNRFFWSGRSDDSEARLSRSFDLSSLPAGSPVELTVRSWWEIEPDYDFGYVMASADGELWQLLSSKRMSEENSSGNNLGAGYTADSLTAYDGDFAEVDELGWVTERFDLSAFAGGPLQLRFAYVTDDAVNRAGWLLDDVEIAAIDYREEFEGDAPGWLSEGWLLSDGLLEQKWLLQLAELDGDTLTGVTPIAVDAGGATAAEVVVGDARSAILVISGAGEGTTLPASYSYQINAAE